MHSLSPFFSVGAISAHARNSRGDGCDKIQEGASTLQIQFVVLNKKHIPFANDSQEQKIFIDIVRKKDDTILLLFFFVVAFVVIMYGGSCEERIW
jgi:hypothetical protein